MTLPPARKKTVSVSARLRDGTRPRLGDARTRPRAPSARRARRNILHDDIDRLGRRRARGRALEICARAITALGYNCFHCNEEAERDDEREPRDVETCIHRVGFCKLSFRALCPECLKSDPNRYKSLSNNHTRRPIFAASRRLVSSKIFTRWRHVRARSIHGRRARVAAANTRKTVALPVAVIACETILAVARGSPTLARAANSKDGRPVVL